MDATGSATWIDGVLFREGDSLPVSVLGRDVLLGNGVFETLAMIDGHVMAEGYHYERLLKACEKMGLKAPAKAVFLKAVEDLKLEYQGTSRARIRVSVYSDCCIAVAQESTAFQESLRLCTLPFRRNRWSALSGVKSTSYGENLQALRWVTDQGASEGVFLDTQAYVCECTTSNLFWMKGDTLYTPSLETGCLPGVGRRVLMEVAHQEAIDVHECEVGLTEAQLADSVFLTSSLRGIQMVKEWDGEFYELNHPGLERLNERFWQFYKQLDTLHEEH